MSKFIEETVTDVIPNIEQVKLDSDTLQTTVTVFIDIEKIIRIGDKIFFIEKKLPFSYMTITTSASAVDC